MAKRRKPGARILLFQKSGPERQGPSTARSVPKRTVLMVEGETEVAESIQDLLEAEGHRCLTAQDVDEAWWILQIAEVDAMVLDMGAAGPNSLEWLEMLSVSRSRLAGCTVVITDRAPHHTEVLKIRSCGAIVLRKPFVIKDLREAIFARLRPAAP